MEPEYPIKRPKDDLGADELEEYERTHVEHKHQTLETLSRYLVESNKSAMLRDLERRAGLLRLMYPNGMPTPTRLQRTKNFFKRQWWKLKQIKEIVMDEEED